MALSASQIRRLQRKLRMEETRMLAAGREIIRPTSHKNLRENARRLRQAQKGIAKNV